MTTAQEQLRMYYDSVRRLGERDETFMEILRDGLTRQELAKNIERNPAIWGRYAGFLKVLPSSEKSNVSWDPLKVSKALRDEGFWPDEEIARVLHEFLGLPDKEVARVMADR